MDQLIVVYLYNGIRLSHQKEENTDTHNIDKSQEHYAEPNKLDTREYTA